MYSDDAMPVQKAGEWSDSNDGGQSLGSLLRNNKSEAATAVTRPPPIVNKEEPHADQWGASSDDDDKPIDLKKPHNPNQPSAANKTYKEPAGPAPVTTKKKPPIVKKEENGDASDDDFKPIAAKRVNAKLPAAAKKVKKKVEVADDKLDEPIAKKKPPSADKKQKASKKVKVEVTAVKQILKKEKKVFDLPGQKRDPPEERDPLRIFYETLYQQVPTSEMAQIWMMESGLLPTDVAKKVLEKKQKKTPTLRSPAKTPSSSAKKTTAKSVTVKRELSSSAKKTTKSVTIKERASSADTTKKKKSPDTRTTTKLSKRRKAADAGDEEESDDDFEVIPQSKKRKLAG